MDFNYESPITKIEQEIASQIVETEEKILMYKIKKAVGYSIDKEELIKALQYDRGQYEKGYNDGYNANKWIPVSERLPELGRIVLCQCRANIYEVLKLTVDGWYYDQNHCYMENFVVAWMPLPEPYKAESEK